jgi:hypothetical protein
MCPLSISQGSTTATDQRLTNGRLDLGHRDPDLTTVDRMMAGDEVTIGHLADLRFLVAAPVGGRRTTGVKPASGRRQHR